MIVGRGVVRKFGRLIREAEKQTIEGMLEGRIPTEPHVTGHFLGMVESIFRERGEIDNIQFRPWYLRDRGPESTKQATEHEHGADFCGVMDIRLPNFTHSKGFLSQAKINGRGLSIGSTSWATTVNVAQGQSSQELRNQVNDMLGVTHESFVIIYGNKRFVVVPATSIKSLTGGGTVYGKPVDTFFKEFLMCFVGDPRLDAGDRDSLESLRERTRSRSALMLQIVGRSSGD